ncbi:MAG TPA: peptidase U32 [Methanosarcina sp.]|jgi:putative protease|nr:peptidase U32 [Methanosarcina sp.]
MKPEKPELLAPAGGMEAFIAAVENGADAVYLGARAFSARGYASNFSEKELEEAIDYAHLRGVKVYVTVNTLLKEDEIENALKLLSWLRNIGTDAIIIQDLGLISLARKYLPDLPLHASTQMTLHNSKGVELAKTMGIERVVLSRECSLEEIIKIKEKTGTEIEVFIHGALCISYSGQCLLSSLIGGRSGNRGFCAQPCRKKYRLYCEEKQVKTTGSYLLSPKDLNTTSGLGALIEARIESFKIEGRMKRPEYVAGVVRIYRRLIDRYIENPAEYYVSEEEQEILTQLFNRGFTKGYFFENPRWKLMSRENPHNRGVPAGTVTGYDRHSNRIRVKLSRPLRLGDGIMVENAETRPEDKGKIISSMYVGKGSVYSAGVGDTVEIPFDSRAPSGSTVYRTHDKKLMDSLKKESELGSLRAKIPVSITATVISGRPIGLEIRDRDANSVTIESEYLVEKAEKQPTSKVRIEKQLSKLGNTIFEAAELHITMEENIFVPVGQLNELRTKAVEQLENLRISRWKRKPLDVLQVCKSGEKESIEKGPVEKGLEGKGSIEKGLERKESVETGLEGTESLDKESVEKGSVEKESVENAGQEAEITIQEHLSMHSLLSVSVYSLEGLKGALEGGADRIYFGEGLFRRPEITGQEEGSAKGSEAVFEKAISETQKAGKEIYLITPKLVKDSRMESIEKIFSHVRKLGADGVLVSNLGILGLAKAGEIPFIADSPLNIFNSRTFDFLLQEGAQMAVISPELTLEELKCVTSHGSAECIVYGRLELMESEHCLTGGLLGNNNGQCNAPCRSGKFTLVDEKNYEFPLLMDYECRMHLLNSRSLCMLEYLPEILESGVSSLRVETLGMDNPDEIRKVTRAYRKAIDTYLETGKKGPENCEKLGKGFTTGHYFRGVQ